MKKGLLLVINLLFIFGIYGQTNIMERYSYKNLPADHVLIQYGYDAWTNKPDSIKIGGGLTHHFNGYFMFNKFNKSNPKFSFAYGIGIGSSHIFFDKTIVDLKSQTSQLPFKNVSTDANYYDQYKLTTVFLQIPVEYRFYSNPYNTNRSWKVAVGAKAGILLDTYTWAKNYQNSAGQSIYGSSYTISESTSKFIDTYMFEFTGRVGYSFASINFGYQITNVLKAGTGPAIGRYSIGLTISGL